MLHEAHAGVSGPALLVIVANDVFVVGVRVLCQVTLDKVPSLICCEPTETRCVAEAQGHWDLMRPMAPQVEATPNPHPTHRTSSHFRAPTQQQVN